MASHEINCVACCACAPSRWRPQACMLGFLAQKGRAYDAATFSAYAGSVSTTQMSELQSPPAVGNLSNGVRTSAVPACPRRHTTPCPTWVARLVRQSRALRLCAKVHQEVGVQAEGAAILQVHIHADQLGALHRHTACRGGWAREGVPGEKCACAAAVASGDLPAGTEVHQRPTFLGMSG